MWLAQSELLQPRVITAMGKCFRYESSNLSGLERLWDFNMREIVFCRATRLRARLHARPDHLVPAQFLDELGMAL